MSTMRDSRRLPPERLRKVCDEKRFDFDSTQGVPPLEDIVGQDRAIDSLEFGLKIESPGYNIFVSGLSGVGRMTLIETHLEKLVRFAPKPEDICLVFNFANPDQPKALILPPGKGCGLRRDMDHLISTLREEIPRSFESKDYERQVAEIAQAGQSRQQELLGELQSFAKERAFDIEFTKVGISLNPLNAEGEKIEQEDAEKLSDEEKVDLERRNGELQEEVGRFIKQAKALGKEARERLEDLKGRVALFAVEGIVDLYREKYEEYAGVKDYLDALQKHIVENLDDFGEQEEKPQLPFMPMRPEPQNDPFAKYRVNVLVDNGETEGAPVVIETSPGYYNLFGRIERKSLYGAMITDFSMIKAGSLLRARGGYLVVNALDVLTSPGVWENLKKVVKHKVVRIEDLGEQYSIIPVSGLKPEPIPTELKIIMIGSARIYHLLQSLDEDFSKIFKVKVDFDSRMPLDKALADYPAFISTRVREENLLHFDRSGVAALVEEGSRVADDQGKASSRFSQVADLVREASYWAEEAGSKLVKREHVARALAEKRFRSNLVEEKVQEMYEDGTILVDVEGAVVGQVNGLAVLDLGDLSFGKPSRITAKAWVGRAGVVDIERESKMAGQIYQKGVLILSGYLGWKYAQDRPLTLSASIAFEQSYSGVDGDSASSTELYALLSDLSGIPIRQGIAVTGSVNQHGQVQAIGGVNQKIEGYFDVCKAKGLTGGQGVMIPASNERHLMLGAEVREAVAAGKFHVWSVESIDQGLEILTGVPAGTADAEGGYPEGTVHRAVLDRLEAFAKGLKGDKNGDEEKKQEE